MIGYHSLIISSARVIGKVMYREITSKEMVLRLVFHYIVDEFETVFNMVFSVADLLDNILVDILDNWYVDDLHVR